MRGSCITLYSTLAVKAGVKKSGKLTPWATQEVWDDVGRCLGVPCVLDDVVGRTMSSQTSIQSPSIQTSSQTLYNHPLHANVSHYPLVLSLAAS